MMSEKHERSKQHLAANVRRMRKMLGMTQVDLAAASSVDQSTISLIEQAKTTPNCFDVAFIAESMNCNTEALLQPVPKEQFHKV